MPVSLFANSLGSKGITQTAGDGAEKIRELLEEGEASLLSSSDQSHLMEANEQHLAARPGTAACSPGAVRLGEEPLCKTAGAPDVA